jgi:hypothetical protein
MRDVTPRPQSRGCEEDEHWSITQEKWEYGINTDIVTPRADGPEEQKEYEVKKNHFMRMAPDAIACTRRAGKAVHEACDAAMKAGEAAIQLASTATKAEEAADKLHQLFTDMWPTAKGPQQTI